jgi:hypothetical protein
MKCLATGRAEDLREVTETLAERHGTVHADK